MSLLATHFTLIYHPTEQIWSYLCPSSEPNPRDNNHTNCLVLNIRCWTLDAPQYLVISDGHFGSLLFYHCIFHSENDKYLTCPHGFRNAIKNVSKHNFCSNHFVLIVGYVLIMPSLDKSEGKWRHNIGYIILPREAAWVRERAFTLCLFNLHPSSSKEMKILKKRINHATLFFPDSTNSISVFLYILVLQHVEPVPTLNVGSGILRGSLN